MKPFALAAFAVFAVAAVAAPKTPQQLWNEGLKESNTVWAGQKHAYLKINDAAYIREGELTSLVGDAKKPSSWHWVKGKQANAALVASFVKGQVVLSKAGKPVAAEALGKGIDIAPGIDVTGGPTQMAPGETGLRLWVFDQGHKEAKAFKGVDYFPYNPAFRVTATFKLDPKMTPRVFRTSRGLDKQFYHNGDAVFQLNGKTVTLPLYGDANAPAKVTAMSSFFIDDTTGKSTYHAGRFVDVEPFGKFAPAKVVIDFNFAYNPNCARSSYFNCPFAIDMIPIAITAGEKDPHVKK